PSRFCPNLRVSLGRLNATMQDNPVTIFVVPGHGAAAESSKRFSMYRRYFPIFSVLFLFSFLGNAPVEAAQIPLAAHRAIYELTLDPEKTGSRVDSARGQIAYEMRGNACEGYSVNLRQVTELDTGEGKQTTSDLRSATWEDGASKNFRFKNQNYVDREL